MKVGIGIQSLDILEESGITVKEMRPGDGHRGTEFARTDVEQTLATARVPLIDHAITIVIGIAFWCVEYVHRRSETET